jgi:endonuclease/exonuclease/phosphatase family metal-dependent hydrolase
MKLASYNIENLFDRAAAMNMNTWADGADILKNFAELNDILGKTTYSNADKTRIVALMKKLGIEKKDEGKFVILRQNHGHLVKRGKGGLQVVADGRDSWIGWLDLKVEAVNEIATRNTARVIGDLKADVIGLVEAESRPALLRFSALFKAVNVTPYEHIMLIDGNDMRGIDVGIMTRQDFPIVDIHSHVDDRDGTGTIFSRDCAEYTIKTPQGNTLAVLLNHFKSKGFGSPAQSDAKRQRQAERVKEIYDGLRTAGTKLIAVIGDFNDFPGHPPLSPLLDGTDLKDISTHAAFDDGGFPGTFGSCGKNNKIDYILLSPALLQQVTGGGIFRKGLWPGKRPKKWDVYDDITEPIHSASDHAAIWAKLDI